MNRRSLKTAAVALAAALTAPLATPGRAQQESPVEPYGADDRAVTALNILPPGQGRYMNGPELTAAQAGGPQPAHNTDQIELYDSMITGAPEITANKLADYYKDATFGVKEDDVERTYEPRPGVVVIRDSSYGIPHIYGATRADLIFGAGYVSAEDRLFMMDTLRHVGRGRLSEFLGASEANLASDRASYLSAGYTEEELQAMFDRVTDLNKRLGETVQQDVTDYTAGINEYISEALMDPTKLPGEYEALQVMPEDWLVTDTVAIASLIGSALGVGGGNELNNAAFINALKKEGMTYKGARQVLADFKFADDPEAPTTLERRFTWLTDLGRVKPKSVAMPDDPVDASDQARAAQMPDYIDGPFGRIRLAFPTEMSNALLVDSKLSKTGRPIAVMGPQVGYWSPEILMEMDLHAPGIDSRGVGFPGISMYTLLGRGRGYAYSATSAGGDQVDIFAEVLCNPDGGEVAPDSTFYVRKGECVEMYTRTDQWFAKPSAGGIPDPSAESVQVEMTTERTDDGIVQARGTVNGKPVAFVAKRASFGAEVDGALTYVEIMDPKVIKEAEDFQRAFARFSFTFNWFYLDDEDIAYQLGGYHPLRTPGVDPDLPVWGTGKWRWRGNLSFADTPHDVSPKKGYITSWNNKQAPGFRASDGQFGYGPVHRVLPLNDGIESHIQRNNKLALVDLVNIMGNAATVDLRGYAVLPTMLKALGKQKDDAAKQAVALLKEWIASGAHRRDRDGDGSYDHSAAVALMDEWWPRALEVIFGPVLGDAYEAIPTGLDDRPGPVGSAYISGLYGHVHKDLRNVLDQRVKGAFSRKYCGKGKLGACRDALAQSLADSIAALTEEFGADPATWDVDEAAEMIQYVAVGVQGQDPMRWQNRPTFQQVVEFK
ncbi:MAG: penicillin acylase family protein [Actinomycetota bacterium]